jgi:hypothetical protein
MAGPPLATRFIQTHSIQPAARIGFEVIHYFLRPGVSFHDGVNVIRSDVGGQQEPAAIRADVLESCQYRVSPLRVQAIRRPVHKLFLG